MKRDMTKSIINGVIHSYFPKEKIKSIREINVGYINRSYEIEFSSGKRDVIIKLLRNKSAELRVRKEKAIIKFLRSKLKNISIRGIIAIDEVGKTKFVIYKKIPGEALNVVYKYCKNRKEIFRKFGEIRGAMHSIHFRYYGDFDDRMRLVRKYKDWYKKKCSEMSKIFYQLKDRGYVSEKFILKQKAFWKLNRHLLKTEKVPSFCHGDLSTSNILVIKNGKNYRISGLIDFEFSRSSSATQDLFKSSYNFDQIYNNLGPFMEGYFKRHTLPINWEELMWFYQWIVNMNLLSLIKTSRWKNLSKRETEQKRKKIIKGCFKKIEKINKKL